MLGGDDRTRERRLDLLRFERDEIVAARISGTGELDALRDEEERLGNAAALRAAAGAAHDLLEEEERASDLLGGALEALGQFTALAPYRERLRGLVAEVDDLAADLRAEAERAEEDPERLAEVQERRLLLTRLAHKHGGSLEEVLEVLASTEHEIADARRRRRDPSRARGRAGRTPRGELAAAEQVVGDASTDLRHVARGRGRGALR